ncbi:MAG: DUF5667 domain-containing protein [Nocardioidaceae bacterium]
MNLGFTARRRAEEFATALDGRVAPRDDHVRQLVLVADALRSMPKVEPGTAWSTALRERLVTEATSVLRPAGPVLPASRPSSERPGTRTPTRTAPRRRLAAAATAFVLIGGGAGLAQASTQSLPGDALYPVKRALERADLAIQTSNSGDGSVLLSQASDRLTEVKGLLARSGDSPSDAALISSTLRDFSSEATQGGQKLMQAYQQSGGQGDITTVGAFVSASSAKLHDLSSQLPTATHDAFAAAARTVNALDQQAHGICPSCLAAGVAKIPLTLTGPGGPVASIPSGIAPGGRHHHKMRRHDGPGQVLPTQVGPVRAGPVQVLPTSPLRTLPPGSGTGPTGGLPASTNPSIPVSVPPTGLGGLLDPITGPGGLLGGLLGGGGPTSSPPSSAPTDGGTDGGGPLGGLLP